MNYLYKSLISISHFNIIESEFLEKMKNVNSTNELIKEFEDFAVRSSNLITNESIVALKHVATGKYLSSVEGFAGSPVPDPNSLWKIEFDKRSATYTLQHVRSDNQFLGININDVYDDDFVYPKYTKVSCKEKIFNAYLDGRWKFISESGTKHHVIADSSSSVKTSGNHLRPIVYSDHHNHSKLENHQVYLKSNDIIYLKISDGYIDYFLRSHDIQFTKFVNEKEKRFQEVDYHFVKTLGENDGVSKLIFDLISNAFYKLFSLEFTMNLCHP
ncbi:hypothetical protein RclHR1_15800004 [Rhizophagus clarus]|uniref:MIR domain-containing protein n=1 Tax=Rhizophagus clarus TaxID=94130 RepID=A0A2Z6R8T6_9GLOM|nr:hypothetical protein RclHR1_15800004 [Rhizophagus clarus]